MSTREVYSYIILVCVYTDLLKNMLTVVQSVQIQILFEILGAMCETDSVDYLNIYAEMSYRMNNYINVLLSLHCESIMRQMKTAWRESAARLKCFCPRQLNRCELLPVPLSVAAFLPFFSLWTSAVLQVHT